MATSGASCVDTAVTLTASMVALLIVKALPRGWQGNFVLWSCQKELNFPTTTAVAKIQSFAKQEKKL